MIQSIIRAATVCAFLGFASPLVAQQPTDAQISAVRSACRGDYKSVCASVPTGGKEALQCLQQHADVVSKGCHDALAPLASESTAPAPTGAATATSPAPVTSPAPALTPRQQAHLLRADCATDFQKYCSSVQVGGGRALACLKEHTSDLTQLCQSALMAAKQP